jgi:hypothetical protein
VQVERNGKRGEVSEREGERRGRMVRGRERIVKGAEGGKVFEREREVRVREGGE